MTSGTAATFRQDMREKGWELIEDVGEIQLFLPHQLELIEVFRSGEFEINGEELVKRAKQMGVCLGQRQGEYLMEQPIEDIPRFWWHDYYIAFPGTIWRDDSNHLRFFCIHWHGRRWVVNLYPFYHAFYPPVRLLRPRE